MSNSTFTITYWSDYACPYCYIGETRLKKALAALNLLDQTTLIMRSFPLDPNAPAVPSGKDIVARIAEKYGFSMEESARQVHQITQLGQQEGLDFHYESVLSTNTLDAHRLTKYAASLRDPVVTQHVIEEFFRANFEKNLPLSDHQVLLDAAAVAGLDTEGAEAILHSDAFLKEVLQDHQEAMQYGIQAVPFFVIGSYYVPGAVTVDDFKTVLQSALAEDPHTAPAIPTI